MGWGDYLTGQAQNLISNKVAAITTPRAAPATVAVTPVSGVPYVEGQPTGMAAKIAGIPKMYLIGGGVLVAGLAAFLMLRK
jgi:hypothetical protein